MSFIFRQEGLPGDLCPDHGDVPDEYIQAMAEGADMLIVESGPYS